MKAGQSLKIYYVNSFPNHEGDYDVHQEGCECIPNFLCRKYLDHLPNAKSAVEKAKKTYPKGNACKTCLTDYYNKPVEFSFLKSIKNIFGTESKNRKSGISPSSKTKTRNRSYKRYYHRNAIPGNSHINSFDSSKQKSCLLILVIYIIIGYMFYQLLK